MDTLSFADAIRLGSMLHPQCYGQFIATITNPDGTITVTGTCALGAAAVALGEGTWPTDSYETFKCWHSELFARAKCPICRMTNTRKHLVMHLNDRHRWTRERIADWVDQDVALAREDSPHVEQPQLEPVLA